MANESINKCLICNFPLTRIGRKLEEKFNYVCSNATCSTIFYNNDLNCALCDWHTDNKKSLQKHYGNHRRKFSFKSRPSKSRQDRNLRYRANLLANQEQHQENNSDFIDVDSGTFADGDGHISVSEVTTKHRVR